MTDIMLIDELSGFIIEEIKKKISAKKNVHLHNIYNG